MENSQIKQGAEAHVELKENKVVKDRREKSYRHPDLDKRLRSERTSEESRRISQANKYGVNTPKVLETDKFSLEMEKIEGSKLRDIIEDSIEPLEELGRQIGILHNEDIIHGDLTTSNIIVKNSRKVFIIDFGLSQHSTRIEDKAVDIHLLKQVLETSHSCVSDEAWSLFVDSYRSTVEDSGVILERLEEVELRGRYK